MAEVYDPLAWLDDLTSDITNGPAPAQSSHNGTTSAPDAGGKDNPATTDTTGSTGGYGGYGGYGYGGGGGGGGGLSEYIQFYRTNFFPQGKPPANLLQKAKDNGWTLDYFAQQVRLKDPSYYRSLEARKILPGFNRTMKVLFPGLASNPNLMKTPFYKRTAMWYLKNGIGTMGDVGNELLYSRITQMPRWKKNNPEYRSYARNTAAAGEANPLLFKQLEEGMKQIFEEQGVALPDDYYKSFFKSRYATESGLTALNQNLKTLSQTRSSGAWFTGRDLTNGEVKQTLFGGEQQNTLRNRLSRAFNVQSSFLGSDQKAFDTQLDERGKIVKPTI